MTVAEKPTLTKQGREFSPSEFRANIHSELGKRVLTNLLFQASPILFDMVDKGIGRKDTGKDVPGREEDDEIEIDTIAEKLAVGILEKQADKYGLSFNVLSEHNNYKIGKGKSKFIISLDPFDNSNEYRGGVNTPPHFVASIYDPDGNPIAAVDADLFTKHLYINMDGKNFEYIPSFRKFVEIKKPKEITSIKDPDFVIASYDGKNKYFRKYRQYFSQLEEDRDGSFHGKGGSHLYSTMARGGVSAYVMFNEPRGEIDPGLAFALSAGYTAWIINSDGSAVPYKFDPKLQRERVPFFTVTSTPQLRNEIVSYAMAVGGKFGTADW